MGTLKLRGVQGSIRWGYHTAAVLQSWSVSPNPDKTYTLHASLTTFDAFRLTQTPLIFSTPTKHGDWEWSIAELRREGSTITAKVNALTKEG